jgi:hypothetical protein
MRATILERIERKALSCEPPPRAARHEVVAGVVGSPMWDLMKDAGFIRQLRPPAGHTKEALPEVGLEDLVGQASTFGRQTEAQECVFFGQQRVAHSAPP